jgi:hypothetical protein
MSESESVGRNEAFAIGELKERFEQDIVVW